ncbi:actin cytoskeleton and mitosis protein [Tieghemiomyces parasiticus]|uniref:Actin cytoskeleton and mitosis protein n=1 Tax=Tieghemiomyces parasiticus TaxID=78921 RepID=A0A9W7ZNX0_9FUNG|nr:actin cytoskeleton and mitosis protein [Tieghemiomyces parasiticus]
MADSREQRFNAQLDHNRYLELKPARARERERCVALGLIPDPNVPRSLDDAITLIGTCQDMCPLFEREEREYQNNVERFEYTPGTRRIDPVRAVKSFHRSAAGNDQPLPSDVRPPDVLLRTLDYLMTHIVTSDEALRDSHGFVRDRTRSIRTDFTLQNSRGPEAVEAHEQIARYHLICCHLMADVEGFSIQQEKEQLGKVLQSLQEFYSDLRADGVVCPNEAEFRAYHICLNLSDNDMIYFAQNLDPAIYADPAVQLALVFHAYAQYGRNPTHSRRFASSRESSPFLFNRFFRLLASPGTPYLLACVLELHFDLVRRNGLHALNSAIQYVPDSEYPLARLAERLGLDGPAQAAALCRAYKIGTTDNTVQLGRKGPHNRRIFEDPERPPHLGASQRLVAQKRTGEVLADIVKGRLSRFTYPPHRAPLLPTAAPFTNGVGPAAFKQPFTTGAAASNSFGFPASGAPASNQNSAPTFPATFGHVPAALFPPLLTNYPGHHGIRSHGPTAPTNPPGSTPLSSAAPASPATLFTRPNTTGFFSALTSSAGHNAPAVAGSVAPASAISSTSLFSAPVTPALGLAPAGTFGSSPAFPVSTVPKSLGFAPGSVPVAVSPFGQQPHTPFDASHSTVSSSDILPPSVLPALHTPAVASHPKPSPGQPLPPQSPARSLPRFSESQCTVLAADIIDNWLTEMTTTTIEEVSRDTMREVWANEQRTRHRLAQAQWCEQRAQTFLDNEVTVSVYLLCQHELAHARASHLQRRWAFRTWHSRYAARKQAQIDRQRQQQHIADSLRAVQAGSFASRPPSAPSTNSLLTAAGPVRNPHLDLARAKGVDHGVLLTNTFQRSAWQSRGQRELWRPGRLATRLCETLRQGQAARANRATGPRPPPSAQLWVLPATPNGLSDRWLLTQFRQPATSDPDGGQTVEPPRAVLGALWRNCPALPDSARILFEQSLVSRSHVSPRPTLGVATTDPTSLEGTGRIDNVDVLAGLIFHVAPPPRRSSDASLYWEQQRCRLVRALECFTQRSRIPVIVVYLPPDNDASTVTLGRELAAQLCLSDLQSRRLLYEYTVAVIGNPAAEKSPLAGEAPQIVPVCDFVAPLTHALSTLVTQWLTISDHFSPYITFDVFAGTLRNHLLDAIDRWERQIARDLDRVVSADSTVRPDTARTVVESYLATLETRIATSWQTFANLTNELLATVARSAAFFNSEGSSADPPTLAAWPALEERAIPSSMTHPTTSAATITLDSALEIVRDFQVDMDKYLAAQFPSFPNTPQVRAEVGKALERYQVRLVRLNQAIHAATDGSVESTRTLSLDLSDLPFPLPHILYRTVQLAIDPYLRHLTPECPVPALRWQTCDLTTAFTRHLRARTADLEATLAAQWAPSTALAAPSPPLSEPGEFIISPCPLMSTAMTHFTTPKRQLSTRQVLAATHKRARRSSDHPLPTTTTSFPWRIAPTTRTASFSSVRPLPATSEPSSPAHPTPVAVAQVAPRDVSPTPHLEAMETRPAPYSRLASLISSVRASLPKP